VRVVKAGWVVKRRGDLLVASLASAKVHLVVKCVYCIGPRRILAALARYSLPGGGGGVGMPGSGAMTGTSLVGAAVVAGPTGTVGCGAAVGAARYGVGYGVAGAGATV